MQISTISPSTFDDGKSVTLTGSGFGASQGQVLIGGVAQNVSTWSDTSITFTTVRGSQSLGACRVDVVGGVSSGYTPTVIVTNQAELNTELAKSAAQLEGQVIGVQYNATPYTISRTQLRDKAIGAGRLVIAQYGATKPVFSNIAFERWTNVTLYGLDCYNVSAPPMSYYAGTISGVRWQSCEIHSAYFDPNGDYSAGAAPGYPVFTPNGVLWYEDFQVTNCLFYNLKSGLAINCLGDVVVQGCTFYNFYTDPLQMRYGLGCTTAVKWCDFYKPVGLESDAAAPHPDIIQLNNLASAETTGDWPVYLEGLRVFLGDSRGEHYGVITTDLDSLYITGHIKGCFFQNNTAGNGVRIQRAKDFTAIGNTVINLAGSGGGLIQIGNAATSGTHVAKNNVCASLSVAGSPTLVNNQTGTVDHAAYFDGPDFGRLDTTTISEMMTTYAMKVGGTLDQTVNIGAVNSGYVDHTARTLNGAME